MRSESVRTLLLAAVILLLAGTTATAELRAGAAKVDITPPTRTMAYPLGGYTAAIRLTHTATGVHDACYARALALDDGHTRCAIVSLDLCFLPGSVRTAVLSRLGDSGLRADTLLLCATHTHSAIDPLVLHGGNVGPAGALPTYSAPLADWMADRIAAAITQAIAHLRPARIGSGQAQRLGLNRNRRGYRLTDDELTALKVTDDQGAPLAAVFDYAAHPTYYDADMLQVSGDWSGAFQRQMEATLPGAVVLFVNGAEGDASPNGSDEGTPAEKIQIYSAKMLAHARALYDRIRPGTGARVDAWTQSVELPPRKPHPFFLLAAGSLRATSDQARALVDRLMPERCDMSFLRAGDALFIGFPGEPIAAVGMAAKAMARAQGVAHPAVTALTNAWLGYIVDREQYRGGKYEATMSFYGETIGECLLEGVKAGLAARKSKSASAPR